MDAERVRGSGVRRSNGRGPRDRTGPLLLLTSVTLVLAVLGGVVAHAVVSASWHSRVSVLVVPAQTDGGTAGSNPLLRLNPRSSVLARLLATAMTSHEAQDYLQRQGASGTFVAEHVRHLRPEIRFAVEAGSPEAATRTAAAVESVARDQLVALQTRADVPGASQATVVAVLGPTPPVASREGQWWATFATALVVLALGTLASAAWLRWDRRTTPAAPSRPRTRRQRRLAAGGLGTPRSR